MDTSKCQICGKPAAFHYTTNINGKTDEVHLCSECLSKHAAEFKGINDFAGFKSLFSFGDDAGLDAFFGNVFGVEPAKSGVVCPHCGMTAADIAGSYKLGCSECYKTFGDLAGDMVTNVGGGKHRGKKYSYSGLTDSTAAENSPKEESEEEKLTKELERAVKEERYGDADKLQKQLKVLRAKKDK